MPLYTYRCGQCGVQFDRQQRFEDAPLISCPECGRPALQKVYSPVGIVFKGSGFYATDHRSSSGGDTKSPKPKEAKPADAKPAGGETKAPGASSSEES